MADEPQANDQDGNKSDSVTGKNGSNKRKRTVGLSSRGVANLTPEQLERKRANDREAQRAIRERTKSQIDRLNSRITELESSQPYRELQAVIAQKDAVQAENDEIKRQLGTVISIIQRFVSAPHGLEGEHTILSCMEYASNDTQNSQRQRSAMLFPTLPQTSHPSSPNIKIRFTHYHCQTTSMDLLVKLPVLDHQAVSLP